MTDKQHIQDLSLGLDEILKHKDSEQCVNEAGLTKNEVEGLYNMALSDIAKDQQNANIKHTGQEDSMLAKLIKEYDSGPKIDVDTVEAKMGVAVDCLNTTGLNP